MGRGDELHAALGDRAGRLGLLLGADLVDDDDLGHVILDRFDHDRVLQRGGRHLHPPRTADAGMRDVAITRDLVRGIDDDDALLQIVGEDARHLTKERRLSDAGPAKEQDALLRLHHVADDLHRPVHRAAHAQGEPDDRAGTIPERADAVERALDPGAVVSPEQPDP